MICQANLRSQPQGGEVEDVMPVDKDAAMDMDTVGTNGGLQLQTKRSQTTNPIQEKPLSPQQALWEAIL
eukprot:10295515-Ditylum_brightwellii.AAC.3